MQHPGRQKKLENFIINVSDYTLKREIETSVNGSVYLVENNNTKKKYAAKIIKRNEEDENNDKYKLNVDREINIMIKCQHPTILKIIGYSLTDIFGNDNVTIFMKYEKKGSLFHYLQKIRNNTVNDYNNTIGQIILVGIARGMMHLHQNQVVHRDLKPGNILLDDHLHPHIIDFGQSKFNPNDQLMQQSQCFGTPLYLAPECIETDLYNSKADVYSFGIIMYEIVTKSNPYPITITRLKRNKFLYKVAEEGLRPTFKNPVKSSIKSLIERCWSKDPDNVDDKQVIEYANNVDNPNFTKTKKKHESSINNKRNEYQEQQLQQNPIRNLNTPQANKGFFHKLCQMFHKNTSTAIGKLTIPNIYLNLHYSRNWNNLDPNKRNIRGGQSYFYPVGFQGFGLYVNNFDENTIVAYHGTRYGNIEPILKDGFKLPCDIGGVNDNSSHMCCVEKTSKDQEAVFVTPSLKFASIYEQMKYLKIIQTR